ncbi:MAG: hypothetical protein A2W99_16500 [Bacteroidetes bacterium GWF2_33_16]|nr:MAG: hypothetical protein A2X00_14295 [Bacteroidetes bacterium GWE2_32_14]OFY03350.1 MAG: hypothetical protein A2W99_16500 [Bacteroidetes bacterium GWF2_33_16]
MTELQQDELETCSGCSCNGKILLKSQKKKKQMKKILSLLTFFSLVNLFCYSQQNNNIEDKFLIVLDIQEYYTKNKLSEISAQKIIDSVNYVINHTDPHKVIYIKSIHKVLILSLSFPFIYITIDAQAMSFDKRMNVVNDHIFINDNFSVFTIEKLRNFLKQINAKEIVMIGVLAEEFISEYLIEGKELGYDMYTIPEAIIGKSQKSKDEAIIKLIKKGIKIIDINTLTENKE